MALSVIFSIRATMTVENKNADERKRDESDVYGETIKDGELWGGDMYPERRGNIKQSWFKKLIGIQGRESIDRNKCEYNVYKCIKDSKTFLIL
ncbi:uncharacterized protein LOC105427899 [Pogonomyrmex barbatus]|uniref:Uncharacterized protein LOC105427899 n=1 Tax=Pogonomyrmex barbatus TaxID=144034 RepID=A0A8N1S5S8_9HYME|nr:uncharacterized protein LOC105427899 [Pogonomyrmex barbatus]